MRLCVLFLLLPFQAQAWTFTPGLICRLSHETAAARIDLTYDPGVPLYSVTISQPEALPREKHFSMRFIGPEGRTISTPRHSFSEDATAVTAEDSGFGNVLDGLQFNLVAEAILGDTVIRFPLEGASAPTAAFRRCTAAVGA